MQELTYKVFVPTRVAQQSTRSHLLVARCKHSYAKVVDEQEWLILKHSGRQRIERSNVLDGVVHESSDNRTSSLCVVDTRDPGFVIGTHQRLAHREHQEVFAHHPLVYLGQVLACEYMTQLHHDLHDVVVCLLFV